MNPNRRDVLFAIFFLASLAGCVLGAVQVFTELIRLEKLGVHARGTYVTAIIAWVYVSVVTPVIHLRRLATSRIRTGPRSWWKFIRLRWPIRKLFDKSVKRLSDHFAAALRRADGEYVHWTDFEPLTAEERNAVEELVEENLGVTDTGEIEENSPWVLMFIHSLIANGIVWSGRFATMEVSTEVLKQDHEIGKVLAEWLANYMLLFVGLLQLTSRGSWFQAILGKCDGLLSTIPQEERNALVALYIVLAKDVVRGLKRKGNYGKVWQNGRFWKAPRISSAVLALLGERFIVNKDGEEWYVDWGCSEDIFEVRPIGNS